MPLLWILQLTRLLYGLGTGQHSVVEDKAQQYGFLRLIASFVCQALKQIVGYEALLHPAASMRHTGPELSASLRQLLSISRRTTVTYSAQRLKLTFTLATNSDAATLATLHTAVSDDLTRRFGKGIWSWRHTERGVLNNLRKPKFSKILMVSVDGNIVASLRLATKKPWAIDVSYFTPVERPLYLVGMAVHPEHQNKGIGRRLLKEAEKIARDWPADAIRLDAFDAAVGAGPFYTKNGFREVARVTYKNDPLIYFEFLLS